MPEERKKVLIHNVFAVLGLFLKSHTAVCKTSKDKTVGTSGFIFNIVLYYKSLFCYLLCQIFPVVEEKSEVAENANTQVKCM